MRTSNHYAPKPGSIAAELIEFLAENPGWRSAKDVAAGIDDCVSNEVGSYLGSAMKHGAVLTRKDANGRNLYRVPSKEEAALPKDPQPDEVPTPRAGPVWAPLGDPVPLEGPRFALDPAGTLTIRTATSATTYDRPTTRALFDWIAESIVDSRAVDNMEVVDELQAQ